MQGCGAGTEGIIYFFSFYLIVNLIFLNLFIAIILDSFQETQLKDQRLFNQESLEYFREHWANYDPQGTSFIPIYKLRDLLANLGPPLGFSDRCKEDRDMQDRFIGQLKLPIYNDFSSYQFLDVLDALSLRAMVLDRIITMRKS